MNDKNYNIPDSTLKKNDELLKEYFKYYEKSKYRDYSLSGKLDLLLKVPKNHPYIIELGYILNEIRLDISEALFELLEEELDNFIITNESYFDEVPNEYKKLILLLKKIKKVNEVIR